MHEVGREPAAELCYGDLNGGRDLKYVYAPRWKHGNQRVSRNGSQQNDSVQDTATRFSCTNPPVALDFIREKKMFEFLIPDCSQIGYS